MQRDAVEKQSCIAAASICVFAARCKEQCDTEHVDDSDTSLIGEVSAPVGVAGPPQNWIPQSIYNASRWICAY